MEEYLNYLQDSFDDHIDKYRKVHDTAQTVGIIGKRMAAGGAVGAVAALAVTPYFLKKKCAKLYPNDTEKQKKCRKIFKKRK